MICALFATPFDFGEELFYAVLGWALSTTFGEGYAPWEVSSFWKSLNGGYDGLFAGLLDSREL